MLLSWEFHKCGKPDCFRQVKAGVRFCCTSCALAADGGYEIDYHSEGCEIRHAERGSDGMEWRVKFNG